MIINTSAVTASIVGSSPLTSLDVLSASITLDETRAPYVEARLVIAVPALATLAALDARNNVRVLVTYTDAAVSPIPGTKSRTFNLLVHARAIDSKDCTVTLTLVSDEAKLIDTGPSPYAHNTPVVNLGSDLRTLVNQVLSEYGATLQAGSATADYTPVFDTANDLTNPSLETNATNWSVNSGGSGARTAVGHFGGFSFGATATGGVAMGVVMGNTTTRMPANDLAGPPRRWSVWVRTPGVGRSVSLYLREYNPAGTFVVSTLINTITSSTTWKELTGYGWPANYGAGWTYTLQAVVATNSTNQAHYFTDAFDGKEYNVENPVGSVNSMVHMDAFGWWLGGADSYYTYSWEGTPHASRFLRVSHVRRSPDALARVTGVMDWDYLYALVNTAGLRLYCDEQRKWWLINSTATLPGTVDLTAPETVTDGDDSISLRDDYYDTVVITYRWTVNGVEYTRQDIADAGLGSTNLLALEYNRQYLGPGEAAKVLARSLGRGRTQDIRALTNITTTPTQAVTTLLPNTVEQTGVVSAVTFEWASEGDSSDEMTVRPRDLEDS